ncbi:MAG: PKD-like domain-containing protein [Bacteroidales bacterium]
MKKIFTLAIVLILSCITFELVAQVGINNNNLNPAASAMLDISSTNKGLLIPRMSSESRNMIPSPATGLLIYNTTTNLFNYFNGSFWFEIETTFVSATTGPNKPGGGVSISALPNQLADSSAMLDASDPIRGFLPTRTTPGAIASPNDGLIIYDISANILKYYFENTWYPVCAVSTGAAAATGTQSSAGVAISTTGAVPHQSAILDVISPDKGVLIPRLTSAQRDQILPATGLAIFNTDSKSIEYFNGSSWLQLNLVITAGISITADFTTVCAGSTVMLSAFPVNGGTSPSYQWRVNGVPVTGATNLQYVYAPVNNDLVSCLLTSSSPCATGNPAKSNDITLTVNPLLPVSISISPSVNPVCAGSSVTFTSTVSNGGTSPAYQWKANGSPISGATNASYTYVPVTSQTITCVVTSNAACSSGNPATSNSVLITITANPIAAVSISPSANPVCAGTSVTFTATVISGGGTTPSFQWKVNGVNAGTNSIIYSYVPANNDLVTCIMTSSRVCVTGSPATSNVVTMTVHPIPSVNPVGNEVYCNGTSTSVVTFSSPVANTTFAWANNTPSIGLAASGTGNLPAFTAINTGIAPVVATITVTPTSNGCVGAPLSFTITVNPTPVVNPQGNAVYCNGASTSAVTFGGPVSGTTYTWTNSAPSIGLGANGTGNISSFTATNTGTSPVIATIIVTPSANGCPGLPVSFTITVNPTPSVNPVNNAVYCNGATTTVVNFGGPVAGTTFAWVNNTPSIGLAANGTGNIPSFTATNTGTSPVIATITVTPSANGCTGTPVSFSITVNPTPAVNLVSDKTYCNGTTTTVIAFFSPVAGTTFSWVNSTPSIGLAANGTGNIPSYTATNTGTTPVIATVVVTPSANGCAGTPLSFNITVYPTTTINPVNNAVYCNGAAAAAVTFGSPVAGTTFTWVNNTPSIGLGANGTGNIPSFTATNLGIAPVVATITVTPSANGCTGTPLSFTITVNPTATVNLVSDKTYCNGTTTTIITLGSPVAGTTFTWVNNTPSIGLAANGTGNIPSYTATNAGTTPEIATITITPSANGCTGTPSSFTITVNPTTTVNTLLSEVYCNGVSASAITFSSPVAGTTYAWVNTTPSIGLAANGTGNISSFTATNTGTTPVVATITVTPSANGCVGTPSSFTITVNPTPTVNPIADASYCNGTTTLAITVGSPVAGTTFTWVNNTPSIGLAANGTGNIPSFSATNSGVAPVVATITVTPAANGCTGIPSTFTITVNPTATVNLISDKVYCDGATSSVVTPGSPVAGTSFTWVNNTPSIGLASSGSGNIPSFTATNAGTEPVIATVTITPSANGCVGIPSSFTITVNPTSTVNQIANASYCNGGATASVTPGSPVAGSTYTWTNNTPSIGLAANGTGNIPSFTATNAGTAPVVASITVTPAANGCVGTPLTFTITVFPTTVVDLVSNKVYCNEATTSAITLGSPVAGTSFAWVNDTPSIGLPATGNGNIPSFTATNTGTSPVVGTITVTPTANGCVGTPSSFTFTINPTSTVNPVNNMAYCDGTGTSSVTFSSPVSGTAFAWVNNTPSIGLAANGTGNIPSFTATNTGTTTVIATITVTPTANGCTGLPLTFTITVYPTTLVNTVPNSAYCNGTGSLAVILGSPVAGTTFTWVNDTPSIGLAASGAGNIPSFTATNSGTSTVSATITVTPTANGCTGTPLSFVIAVYPTTTVNLLSNSVYCNGTVTSATTLGSLVAGTTFAWVNDTPSIGLAANGTGNIPSFTATNTGTSPIVATITITPTANGCTGISSMFTITVNPTPVVNQVSNVTYCNGTSTSAINLGSPVAGTTYTWVNNTPSIGLSANGTGNIPSFTATNTVTAPVVATITVTPTANGCTGVPSSFTITVYPTATVSPISNEVYCNGAVTSVVSIGSPVTGTTFTWVNNTPSIGLSANGSGNIPSFTATNTNSAPVIATITITPSANGCVGTPLSFTITVNPTPTVNQVNNAVYCNGANTTTVNFGSPVAGTTYAWDNNTPSIGLAANGTGNLASFTATNTGLTPVIATITVTPSANGCVGPPSSFTITVNPTSTVNTLSNAVYCNGATTTAVTFGSPVAGTTYTWSNSNTAIGLAASGAGNIASFTATNTGTVQIVATITVTPAANGCTGTPSSFTITVNPSLPVSITITPSANNVCAGTSVTFSSSVINGGTPPAYQWKLNGNVITGATNATYAYVPLNAQAITCVLTSNATCATGSPATSNSVTMTVVPLVPVVSSIVASQYAMMPGTSVTFTASVVNGGSGPVYQWKVNGLVVGTNSPTYTYTPLNNDKVTCVITSNSTIYCLSNNPATSNRLAMVVYTAGTACSGTPTVSYGGLTYNTVQIGTQCWLRENINIGSFIPKTTTQTNNAIVEKYCYNDSTINCDIYGGLYQWNEMMQYVTTPGTQGVCPSGWHVPTEAEFVTLANFAGGATVAGGKLKEAGTSHFRSPNTGATNEYGFTALPTGYSYSNGTPFFSNIYTTGYFHTSTDYALPNGPVFRSVSLSVASLGSYYNLKSTGNPVRCLKN